MRPYLLYTLAGTTHRSRWRIGTHAGRNLQLRLVLIRGLAPEHMGEPLAVLMREISVTRSELYCLSARGCNSAVAFGDHYSMRFSLNEGIKMNRTMAVFSVFMGWLFMVGSANANCVCRCVNGEVRPICQSPLSVPPPCAPTICPITPPSVEPIRPPVVPPPGTQGCRQVQVLNPRTGMYEWKTVCS